jgi:dTDP-4-dehydrorhamnose reductase
VFDGQKKSAYVETDQTAPSTIYGQSKLAGEVEVQKANPKHIILRTEWIHSPFGRCFVSNILQRAQLGMPLKVVNDQYGNPTYAPHLVDAILAVAAHLTSSPPDAIPWGIYHAAGTGTATWYDVAREVLIKSEQLTGLSFSLDALTSAEYLTRSHRSPNSQLDCSKLKQTFGVTLPAWQEGVHACVGRLLI